MPTLAAILKSEIRRHAVREMARALRPLRRVQKQVKALRVAARGQRRTLATLERRVKRLRSRAFGAPAPAGPRGPRIAAESIRSLRARLGMTRLEFAALMGVSPGSIFGWEKGRTVPRGKSRARFAEIRKLGVRAVRQGAQRAAATKARRRVARRGRHK
jgi:DNA-binding XRE family transcriptional regulator